MQPHSLPTPYQSYIHKSRYAKWRDDLNRREEWNETVDRYTGYWHNKFPGVFPSAEINRAIAQLEVMPSMRALMTAGPALDRDPIAGFNPVAGDTLVVTREFGNVPIRELEGKTASVLNKHGEWTSATFRSYGQQRLMNVVLRLNSNTVKEVKATANHRWVLSNDQVVPTSLLSKGDKIDFISAPKAEIDDDYILGVRHGIVFGDGTATKSCKRVKGYNLRLCKEKSNLLKYFDGYSVSYPQSANGDPFVYLYDEFAATHDLKALPSENETEPYILGFFRGWMAADGSIGRKNPQITLCCQLEGKDWLLKYAERAGFVIQGWNIQPRVTNFGERNEDSFVVRISRSTFTDEDVLSTEKKEFVKPISSSYSVHSVTEIDEVDEVFCAEVPDTNTFVLATGLLTGNCSYIAVDDVRAFDEILMVLMCGTGVGFGVELQHVSKLPLIPNHLHDIEHVIQVRDSKGGWASAFRELLTNLYYGMIPKWDVSQVRPAGARLKTFGGRASGPQPLVDLFEFTIDLFQAARGRHLQPIECHDLVCKIADIVVVGGVRRSALISIQDIDDSLLANAKGIFDVDQYSLVSENETHKVYTVTMKRNQPTKPTYLVKLEKMIKDVDGVTLKHNPAIATLERQKKLGWWIIEPQRALANNSAAYKSKPNPATWMQEMVALYSSYSGERGLFNLEAAHRKATESGRRIVDLILGTNPCAEIFLRSCGLCNLSEVILRHGDTLTQILEKVRLATIIGTFQSTLTEFRYVRDIWKQNQIDERLLGVSLTGIMDHEVLSQTTEEAAEWLRTMKQVAIETNKEWALKLGIKPSAAITCVKPSGTVSQLVDCSSGIHAAHAPYYLRTVRADKKDPLAQMMRAQGFPVEDAIGKETSTDVYYFPMKSNASNFRNDRNAIQQLEHYLMVQRHWSEHNVSNTIYYHEHEFLDVVAWMYKHFDELSGVSLLPHTDHVYQQAPYTDITEAEYYEWVKKMPKADWAKLPDFEKTDATVNTKELACSAAGGCELV